MPTNDAYREGIRLIGERIAWLETDTRRWANRWLAMAIAQAVLAALGLWAAWTGRGWWSVACFALACALLDGVCNGPKRHAAKTQEGRRRLDARLRELGLPTEGPE